MEQALKTKEEEMDHALSGLRLDHEKMRTALETKLRSCQDPGRGGVRVKELERQVMNDLEGAKPGFIHGPPVS